ncbi:T9SS type A sorting domain-containing protein [Aquimarina sp. 2201CG14-23]|uniref:T9SS type A sorting domain-containing protein n=1 Tax=Aquimarina mycalae TaxID=3040073 RepID=UPI0024781B47|nr:T9SS type A sorting domain-containing protein [Aquimarina sp. 2201CG14-23]MDH7446714.1 T9SS type A sorting domain-containing protein [Aquimarina sp. 2201CG14-23]
MKKITFLLSLLLTSFSFAQLSINEVDADQTGTDSAEFIELLSSTPNFALDGFVVVLYNGSDDQSYAAYDLDGFSTDANGLFVLGNTGVTGASITLPSNGIQNGADVVAIFQASDTDFPNDTAITTTNLIDVIVYGTNDADDTVLLTGFGETTQYNDTATESLQLTDDQTSYVAAAPTPGALNNLSNPSLSIDSPSDNNVFTPGTASVDISFTVGNFALGGSNIVEYIVNGGTPMTTTSSPIAVSVMDGQSYTVTLELKDAGGSLMPQVLETINFSVGSLTNVANIAALRAGTVGNFYTLTGEAILTFQQSFRFQKFIEDGTGAILIDDNSGTVTTAYSIGDGITGITGELGDFNGQLQFIPSSDPGAASSTGNSIDPQFITVADLVANPEDYESELVAIGNITVDNTPSTTWDNGTEYPITQNMDNFTFRTTFFDVDYIGLTVPTTPVNIVGLITERNNGSYFITARDNNDFPATLSVAEFTDDNRSLRIFPNPVYDGVINFPAIENSNAEIKIFNVLGTEVVRKRLNSDTVLDVSNLTTGIYLVQLFENDKRVSTDKLIIR